LCLMRGCRWITGWRSEGMSCAGRAAARFCPRIAKALISRRVFPAISAFMRHPRRPRGGFESGKSKLHWPGAAGSPILGRLGRGDPFGMERPADRVAKACHKGLHAKGVPRPTLSNPARGRQRGGSLPLHRTAPASIMLLGPAPKGALRAFGRVRRSERSAFGVETGTL
jgi:hypothetical protein